MGCSLNSPIQIKRKTIYDKICKSLVYIRSEEIKETLKVHISWRRKITIMSRWKMKFNVVSSDCWKVLTKPIFRSNHFDVAHGKDKWHQKDKTGKCKKTDKTGNTLIMYFLNFVQMDQTVYLGERYGISVPQMIANMFLMS